MGKMAHTFGVRSVLRLETDLRTWEFLSATGFLFPHVVLKKLVKIFNERNKTSDCEGMGRPSGLGVGIQRMDRVWTVEVKAEVPA